MFFKRKFPDEQQEASIVAAIVAAERDNRGEIRVHLEARCKGDALTRARELFIQLGMSETAADTGILLYVSHKSRKVAVFAGTGIHAAVDSSAWQALVDGVAKQCAEGHEVDGVCAALDDIGTLLRQHLPANSTDRDALSADASPDDDNELPDQVTTS